jgi:hypothetical protein
VSPDPTAQGQLSPGASLFLVFLVLATLAVALLAAIFWAIVQKRRGAQALASVTSSALPARGSVVVHGVVETEDPERPAITVTLWERGEEQKTKHGWRQTWTEERREARVEPFYLKPTTGGTRVRVEPGDDVLLVDALEPGEPGNPRTRRARLTDGETAFVSGVIGRGPHARGDAREASAYRGGPLEGPVLRSGRDRMLVSTEPLDGRYVRQANVHRLFSAIFGVALLLSSMVLYRSTLAIELFGKTVDAEVVSSRTWTTKGRGGVTRHYALTARYQDAAGRTVELQDDVNADTYRRYEAKQLPRQTFAVAFDNPALCNVGERPTVGVASAIAPIIVTVLLLLMYFGTLRRAREWYDQPRVVTTAQGRLPT